MALTRRKPLPGGTQKAASTHPNCSIKNCTQPALLLIDSPHCQAHYEAQLLINLAKQHGWSASVNNVKFLMDRTAIRWQITSKQLPRLLRELAS